MAWWWTAIWSVGEIDYFTHLKKRKTPAIHKNDIRRWTRNDRLFSSEARCRRWQSALPFVSHRYSTVIVVHHNIVPSTAVMKIYNTSPYLKLDGAMTFATYTTSATEVALSRRLSCRTRRHTLFNIQCDHDIRYHWISQMSDFILKWAFREVIGST